MLKRNPGYQENIEDLPLDITNQMSFFYAGATPMLTKMSETVSTCAKDKANKPEPGNNITTDILAIMNKVCQKMLEVEELRKQIKNKEQTELFILRVMVGLVILYDHVHPEGAFVKGM